MLDASAVGAERQRNFRQTGMVAIVTNVKGSGGHRGPYNGVLRLHLAVFTPFIREGLDNQKAWEKKFYAETVRNR